MGWVGSGKSMQLEAGRALRGEDEAPGGRQDVWEACGTARVKQQGAGWWASTGRAVPDQTKKTGASTSNSPCTCDCCLCAASTCASVAITSSGSTFLVRQALCSTCSCAVRSTATLLLLLAAAVTASGRRTDRSAAGRGRAASGTVALAALRGAGRAARALAACWLLHAAAALMAALDFVGARCEALAIVRENVQRAVSKQDMQAGECRHAGR